ncbi:MAG: triose-phosphate isomerase [Spirochaetota bacterium]
MRKPLVAGNWKMYLDRRSGVELAQRLVEETAGIEDKDILVCPGFPLLSDVGRVIEGSRIMLGAQNMYFEREGAFTGEVSAEMLLSVGCKFVIIGHSERRHVFHESNEEINKKVIFAIQSGLRPIMCVGELLEERESGNTKGVVEEQLTRGLKGVSERGIRSVVIAYEPVWAIGTGKTATPENADDVQGFIRNAISDLYGDEIAGSTLILYGGSVKPENIDGLMSMENIDGVLVGGASLKADSFSRIIKYKVSK